MSTNTPPRRPGDSDQAPTIPQKEAIEQGVMQYESAIASVRNGSDGANGLHGILSTQTEGLEDLSGELEFIDDEDTETTQEMRAVDPDEVNLSDPNAPEFMDETQVLDRGSVLPGSRPVNPIPPHPDATS